MPKKPGFFKRLFSRKKKRQRGFDAAGINRILGDWIKSSTSIDRDIKAGLTVLRARSRDLCQNNDYGRRFLWLLASNVVGPSGIRLQSKVKKAPRNGTEALDADANAKIEAAWKKWGRRENCSVDRKMSFVDLQRLIIQTVARDGELLIRKSVGFDNPFGFALQVIEPDYLDHTYDDEFKNIRMGIEHNKWKEPIAYHIFPEHPGDHSYTTAGAKYQRVSADQVLHPFIVERADQTRGTPWTATALKRLYQVGRYEESELVAARVGAAKMGFFYREDAAGYSYDDKDEAGNLISEVAPGKFEELPAGYRFEKFDIDHPNSSFDDFIKSMLKGAASGLNLSYMSLSSDLSGTSYSSGRQGLLEDRDYWRLLQGWMVEHVMQPIFDAWLPWAIAGGQVGLTIRDIERWNAPMWQARRWSWIDPAKDMVASEKAVALGINSRTRIAAEQGADLDDIFDDLAREGDKATALGITIEGDKKGDTSNDDKDDKDRDTVSQLHAVEK